MDDSLAAIELFETDTYCTLCRICSRPSFTQLALRSCQTILKQADFSQWNIENNKNTRLRPKITKFQQNIQKFYNNKKHLYFKPNKDLLNEYLKLNSPLRRRVFIRVCTGRLFLSDLQKRGFETPNNSNCLSCKRQKLNQNKDTVNHFITSHLKPPLKIQEAKQLKNIQQMINNGKIKSKVLMKLYSSLNFDDIVVNPVKLKKLRPLNKLKTIAAGKTGKAAKKRRRKHDRIS